MAAVWKAVEHSWTWLKHTGKHGFLVVRRAWSLHQKSPSPSITSQTLRLRGPAEACASLLPVTAAGGIARRLWTPVGAQDGATWSPVHPCEHRQPARREQVAIHMSKLRRQHKLLLCASLRHDRLAACSRLAIFWPPEAGPAPASTFSSGCSHQLSPFGTLLAGVRLRTQPHSRVHQFLAAIGRQLKWTSYEGACRRLFWPCK